MNSGVPERPWCLSSPCRCASASTFMVRNFQIVKDFPPSPIRCCR